MTETKIIQYTAGADDNDNEEGTYIKRSGMKPPAPQPGMLNKEMAEAAAKIFKEKEKDIQEACAKVDAGEHKRLVEPTPTTQQRCGCIIL
jgi:hypothetical protein